MKIRMTVGQFEKMINRGIKNRDRFKWVADVMLEEYEGDDRDKISNQMTTFMGIGSEIDKTENIILGISIGVLATSSLVLAGKIIIDKRLSSKEEEEE